MFLVVLALQVEEPEKDTTPQADAGSVQHKGANMMLVCISTIILCS